MRAVAISTIRKGFLLTNYGSFFQHYALRKVLRGLGYQPFRVRLHQEHASFLSMLADTAVDAARMVAWIIRRRPDCKKYILQLIVRDYAYWLFRRDFNRLIGAFDEQQLFNQDTIGVRGGDQVLYPDDNVCWLSGVQNGNPLITYAASADWQWASQSQDWRESVGRQLSRYTAIGIRESRGVDMVRSMVSPDVSVEQVADPVFLLSGDDFYNIESEVAVFSRPTLFCYLVNIDSDDDIRLSEYEQLAKDLGCELKILLIQGVGDVVPSRYRVLYSPKRFLRAIHDAKYFLTNSYHGSVFAIIYQKMFLSIQQRCVPGKNQNERQEQLMAFVGLSGRWVGYDWNAEQWAHALRMPVDWDKIGPIIGDVRNKSINWLRGNLAEREGNRPMVCR